MAVTYRRVLAGRRVLVNLKTGKAVAGFLWEERAGLVTLKDAILHEVNRPPTPVPGEVVIPKDNVDFVQVIPPAPNGDGS